MKLMDILKDIAVLQLRAGDALDITGICYDSRKVKPGDLFVAVRGYESDGHRFIPMAVEKGCAAEASVWEGLMKKPDTASRNISGSMDRR